MKGEARLAAEHDNVRAALERALAATGSAIVEVRTDRAANVALHRRVWDAVSRRAPAAARPA